jgi:hypothetical protein
MVDIYIYMAIMHDCMINPGMHGPNQRMSGGVYELSQKHISLSPLRNLMPMHCSVQWCQVVTAHKYTL